MRRQCEAVIEEERWVSLDQLAPTAGESLGATAKPRPLLLCSAGRNPADPVAVNTADHALAYTSSKFPARTLDNTPPFGGQGPSSVEVAPQSHRWYVCPMWLKCTRHEHSSYTLHTLMGLLAGLLCLCVAMLLLGVPFTLWNPSETPEDSSSSLLEGFSLPSASLIQTWSPMVILLQIISKHLHSISLEHEVFHPPAATR